MNIWLSFFLALLSGTLATLAFPPANFTWICWVAWTPLISALWFGHLGKHNLFKLFALGYLAGLSFFWISLFWLHEVTTGGWLLLGFGLSVYPALWALFVGTVGMPRQQDSTDNRIWLNSWNNLYRAALGAGAWAALEWLRGLLFTGFGWNAQGVALHHVVPLIQIADITGVYGVSFLIIMINLILVMTIRRLILEIRHYGVRPHWDFTLTLLLTAGAFLYGLRQIMSHAPAKLISTRIACVQAAVPQVLKWDPAFDEAILENYRTKSQAAIRLRPQLLIWPEAATPHPALLDDRDRGMIQNLAQSFPGDFLLGTIHFQGDQSFNSAVLFTEHGQNIQLYSKIHLVPFGEYIPLRHSFPIFAWAVGTLIPNDFTPGSEPVVFSMQSVPLRIAPLICFEDTLGSLARLFVLKKASFFAVMTNDGWFKRSAGSEQHLANAVFRTAEFKLPMVRCANTGVTCFIDRFGYVTQQLSDPQDGTFGSGILVGELQIPTNPTPTFYARFGNIFAVSALLLTGIVAAFHCGAFYWVRRSRI
ncbi:MAG: apolipoprotein N-acyltransferase [Verrucomicrobia bacterium]|nr:MAG: apolipoprotein N-acyltransferase [Verrucomicrobiota bacterium]